MRILRSLGLVALAGIYVVIIVVIPTKVTIGILFALIFIGLFLYGYFLLFNPKK